MLGRQNRLLDACTRAEGWLSKHVAESDDVARPFATFSELLERARNAATQQVAGKRTHAALTVELREAVRRLREHHIRPIVIIARASADNTELAGLSAATTLPRYRMPVTFLLANAGAMRDIVRPHKAWFVRKGRLPDFLEQLDTSIAAIEALVRKRTDAMLLHVGATAALSVHLSYARKYLDIIDASIEARFDGNDGLLTEWRAMRHVHQKPGPKAAAPSARGIDRTAE